MISPVLGVSTLSAPVLYLLLPSSESTLLLTSYSLSDFLGPELSSPMGLAYLAPWWLPLVPGLLPAGQLDGLELQENGPGVSASPSTPKTPGDSVAAAPPLLTGQIATGFLTCRPVFLGSSVWLRGSVEANEPSGP